MSSALMVPAHFAEVSTRNAVADVLELVYGPSWPWDATLEQSLPSPGRGYNPRRDLVATRNAQPTTGKVIAELKFVFWQRMFTARHDQRLWIPHINQAFKGAPSGTSAGALRGRLYDDLEVIRKVRNRIAHHEPIFTRDLSDDLSKMLELIHMRSGDTASWVRALEDVTATIAERNAPAIPVPGARRGVRTPILRRVLCKVLRRD